MYKYVYMWREDSLEYTSNISTLDGIECISKQWWLLGVEIGVRNKLSSVPGLCYLLCWSSVPESLCHLIVFLESRSNTFFFLHSFSGSKLRHIFVGFVFELWLSYYIAFSPMVLIFKKFFKYNTWYVQKNKSQHLFNFKT